MISGCRHGAEGEAGAEGNCRDSAVGRHGDSRRRYFASPESGSTAAAA